MSNNFIKVVSKMDLKKYNNLTKKQIEVLDKKAEKVELLRCSQWKDNQIRDWIGLWYYSAFIFDKTMSESGFVGWVDKWEMKLINTCRYAFSDFKEIKKVAKILDNLDCSDPECIDQSKECKQFILKMIETLGFRSLLCVGI
jgi:hypothetical protein